MFTDIIIAHYLDRIALPHESKRDVGAAPGGECKEGGGSCWLIGRGLPTWLADGSRGRLSEARLRMLLKSQRIAPGKGQLTTLFKKKLTIVTDTPPQ